MHSRNPNLWATMWNKKFQKTLKVIQKLTKNNDLSKMESINTSFGNLLLKKKHLVRNYCSIYPYQVIKVVRLRLGYIEPILATDTRYVSEYIT